MTKNLETLPFGGGWAEQPAWITEALSALTVEESRMEAEKYGSDND